MNLSLPITPTDFAPIIVSSPTIRSGTTLVQRLLCSARNTLIFGEACGQDLEILLKIVQSKALVYHYNKPQFETALARMQSGEVNDWILDLMPEIDSYVQALTAGAFSGLRYCRDYAAESDRPLWGFKYPGWPPHTLSLMNQFMPKSKWVYVYRDLEACLRSAKAWGEIRDLSEAQAFCRTWAENLRFMQTWEGRLNVLMIDFADLIGDPDKSLRRLGEFTGALGMERVVFDHKVNRETGIHTDIVGSGYILPASLTETEHRLVSEARTFLDSDNLNSTAKIPVDRQAGT